MAMPSVKHRWTAREVRRVIEESPLATPRYELVDGELLVTPSPNWTHQTAVSQLLAALIEYLKHSRRPSKHVAVRRRAGARVARAAGRLRRACS